MQFSLIQMDSAAWPWPASFTRLNESLRFRAAFEGFRRATWAPLEFGNNA